MSRSRVYTKPPEDLGPTAVNVRCGKCNTFIAALYPNRVFVSFIRTPDQTMWASFFVRVPDDFSGTTADFRICPDHPGAIRTCA